MPSIVPLRKAIPLAHTWNVESIFPTDTAWEREFDELSSELPSLARFSSHLADSAATLADWFAASEQIESRLGKVVLYANMKHTVDTGDQTALALNDRARGLAARAAGATSFGELSTILPAIHTSATRSALHQPATSSFALKWVRTDYTFESQERARTLVEFFFGRMVEHEVLASGEVTVPECTGIWWKKKQE